MSPTRWKETGADLFGCERLDGAVTALESLSAVSGAELRLDLGFAGGRGGVAS